MNARSIVLGLTPPSVLALYRRLSGRSLRFAGHPADWTEATRMSSGYAAANILERVRVATRSVVAGAGKFERDSVLFDEPQFPFPLLTGLLRAAVGGGGTLTVVDFGGSLGSSYRQCRALLNGVASLAWHVVEQPSFVAAGQEEFTTDELKFFGSLSLLPPLGADSVVLASSVLQYLEDPTATLSELSRLPSRHLLIDRTPVAERTDHRLCVQQVPRRIYESSYPCWILSRDRLLAALSDSWKLRAEYPCPDGAYRLDDGTPFEFRGFILERRG